LKLFLDENIPPQIAVALKALGHEAVHLEEYLPRASSDQQVLRFLADHEDWYFVSQDSKISRRPHERAALLQAGVGAYFYTGRAERSVDQPMVLMLETLPQIKAHAARTKRPFMIGISDQKKLKPID